MRDQAALLRAGGVIARRPIHELLVFGHHVAAGLDARAVSRHLPLAESVDAKLRVNSQEDNQVEQRLDLGAPCQRGSGQDPAQLRPCTVEKQINAFVAVSRRRIGWFRLQPEKVVGFQMQNAHRLRERTSKRRGSRTGSTRNVDVHHGTG
jgi:hypothetical protein